MIYTNVPEMLVSGAPIVPSLPIMLFLLSRCCLCTALYTVKTSQRDLMYFHVTLQ